VGAVAPRLAKNKNSPRFTGRTRVMALVQCEVHSRFGNVAVSVAVRDTADQPTFLEMDRTMVTQRNGRPYLPVGVVHRDKEKDVALIEFPVEADSGAHRICVRLNTLVESNGVSA
jgi:hypothetical protein